MGAGPNPLHGYDTPPGADAAPPSPHRPTRAAPSPSPGLPRPADPGSVASRRRAGAATFTAFVPIGPARRRTLRQWIEALTGAAALGWAAYGLIALTVAGLLGGLVYLCLTGQRP